MNVYCAIFQGMERRVGRTPAASEHEGLANTSRAVQQRVFLDTCAPSLIHDGQTPNLIAEQGWCIFGIIFKANEELVSK